MQVTFREIENCIHSIGRLGRNSGVFRMIRASWQLCYCNMQVLGECPRGRTDTHENTKPFVHHTLYTHEKLSTHNIDRI